jgi:hypothetical protein
VTPHERGLRHPGEGRQDQQPGSVAPDTDLDRRDKNLTPGDRDDRAIRRASEPPYGFAPGPSAADSAQRTAGPAREVSQAQDNDRPTGSRRRAPDSPDTTNARPDLPDASSQPVWTVEAVRRLGLTTDIETAGSILGIGRTKAYELARSGNFPVKVLRGGKRYLVSVPAILRALDVE